jgi:uncharacterized membrane protein
MKKNKNINRAEKRKIEKINKNKKIMRIGIISIILIIAVGTIVFVGMSLGNNEIKDNKIIDDSTDISTGSQILIPISDIGTTAKFYSYESKDVEIKYFIVKGNDDVIKAAFDACDLCYNAKKGYRQDVDVMTCLNCGLTFPINELGETNTGGGCWPSYLPIKIDGNNIIIEKSDLENKINMF